MKSPEMGTYKATQQRGQTIFVKVIQIEQRLGRNHGKWVCHNETTGRTLHRTHRQLRPAMVRFTSDDGAGALWAKGDLAEYLGPESDHPDAPPIKLLRLLSTGETLSLTDPLGRGLCVVHRS